MKATQDLRAEHVGVIRMLDIMEAMTAQGGQRTLPDSSDLEDSIEFLRVFVDRCHHAKEEVLLFPAMAAVGDLEAQAAIDLLLAEHRQAREQVARLEALSERVADDDTSIADELARSIGDYSDLLRGHIELEEDRVFGPADAELNERVQEELAEGYDKIESETIGEGVHERFHEMLDDLGAKYLAPPT